MRPIPIPFPFLSLCFSSNLASLTVFILACTLPTLSLHLSLSLLSTPSIVPAPPRPTVYRSFFRLRCDIYLEVSTMRARGPRRHLHDLFRRRNNVSTLVGPGDRSITGARREFSLSLSLHGLGPDFRYGPAERRKSAESVIYPKWSTVLPVKSTG